MADLKPDTKSTTIAGDNARGALSPNKTSSGDTLVPMLVVGLVMIVVGMIAVVIFS